MDAKIGKIHTFSSFQRFFFAFIVVVTIRLQIKRAFQLSSFVLLRGCNYFFSGFEIDSRICVSAMIFFIL